MKKHIKTIALVTAGLVVGVVVARKIENIDKRTTRNLGKLSTRPGISEIDRLDNRIDGLAIKYDGLLTKLYSK